MVTKKDDPHIILQKSYEEIQKDLWGKDEVVEKTRITDSGSKETFESGAQRDIQEDKGFFHLLSPYVLRRLAVHMERGARKYGVRNWEKGMPLSVFFNSATRHSLDWLMGKDEEDHLAAWLWNIHCLLHTEEMIKQGKLSKELDDI